MLKRVRYIFPPMRDFREDRPRLVWEFIYGWMGGYGLLFDPLVQPMLDCVPEWECGWSGRARSGDFFIACSRDASRPFCTPRWPGLYFRALHGVPLARRDVPSNKERLETPAGAWPYPTAFQLTYDTYTRGAGGWRMGEWPVVTEAGRGLAVGFDLFAFAGHMPQHEPERAYLDAAELMRALLAQCGLRREAPPPPSPAGDGLRLDCHAYGLNRLFLQWFLDLNQADRNAVAPADRHYLAAGAAWRRGAFAAAEQELGAAFGALAALRNRYSPLDLRLIEIPHLGILVGDRGYFELEWPTFARDVLRQYEQYTHGGYRVAVEGGAQDWQALARLYPETTARIGRAWEGGRMELTNGTWSLPYALLSPLALQYEQFRFGRKAFRKTFGRVPSLYQCQENSLTPQLPELLAHFGYAGACHITQNHGTAPGDESPAIRWTSPAGYGLPALTVQERSLARVSVSFYMDLPLVHQSAAQAGVSELNRFTFQDLGYVPFRVHMLRAHRYAPVWGRYALPSERLKDARRAALPERTFHADSYQLSRHCFYGNETNRNALSQYETVFGLAARHRQLRFAAWRAERLTTERKAFEEALADTCLCEAHDITIVSGQRRGDFFAPHAIVDAPSSRDMLAGDAAACAERAHETLDAVQARLNGRSGFFNAAGAELPFARPSGRAPAAGEVLAGPFAPWSVQRPAQGPAVWTPCTSRRRFGLWGIAADRGGLQMTFRGQPVTLRVVDRTGPEFEVLSVETWRAGPLVRLRWVCLQPGPRVEAVRVEVCLHDHAPLAELTVTYAPGREFGRGNRWDDYLAVEVVLPGALAQVWRFNPNVQALTSEDRVVSPYLLAVEPQAGPPLSLLNEGAFCYELDRTGGRVRWLFHVADEQRWTRRMALLWGTRDGFETARAWGQGVLPVGAARRALPRVTEGTEALALETVLDPSTILMSNLRDTPTTVALAGAGLRLSDVKGRSLVTTRSRHRIVAGMKPLQLALLKTGKATP